LGKTVPAEHPIQPRSPASIARRRCRRLVNRFTDATRFTAMASAWGWAIITTRFLPQGHRGVEQVALQQGVILGGDGVQTESPLPTPALRVPDRALAKDAPAFSRAARLAKPRGQPKRGEGGAEGPDRGGSAAYSPARRGVGDKISGFPEPPHAQPMTPSPETAPDQHSFLLDSEQIQTLAEPEVVRLGLRHFKDNRVTYLDWEADHLWAEVEDEGSEEIVSLELAFDAEGKLGASCGCGADGEGPCAHAVAALFAFGARNESPGRIAGAITSAIEERAKRGRAEVKVDHLSGEQWFGTWSARSITPTSHFPANYRVNIRSLTRKANYCTCPDFATNQLGTCKHIEAVLHKIKKRRDAKKLKDLAPPSPYVYLDWEAEQAPVVRLHRAADMDPELASLLDDFFDAAGAFQRRLPEDFLRLADLVAERGDLDVGQDALSHARRLAETAARQVRAQEISERVRSTGGRLPGVSARLYPYQMEGVAFLAGNGRALLADDMGLGKTLQAIAAATWLRQEADAQRVLIVCPASLKQQWAREIHKFTGQQTQVVLGPAASRAVQYRRGGGFFVVNYELVLRDVPVINETLRPDLLILDEAQRIKNWRTKIASAVKRISARYAFVLSGTPLENRLEDLYSLMQVVDQKILGPLWRYLVDFHVTDERGKVLGYRNLSVLRRRLAPVMLRRDRRLVRDQLPDRIEQRIDVELTDIQQGLHDAALANAGRLAQIAKKRPLTPSEQNRLLASLQQARMACDAAGLVDKETEGSPKLDELETILEELCLQAGLKAVVFSQWEQMTQMVEQRLRRMGIGSVRLHGGVPSSKRGELIDRFHQDDAVQVFISTDSGGVGLNLQCASVLVNLDIPWNPAVLDQRIARIHRLGQTQKVQILLLVAANSYEERVFALVQGKRDLFDNVVDPEGTEDVISVSKKLVEVLAEDLAGAGAAAQGGGPTEAAPEGGQPEPAPAGRRAAAAEVGGSDIETEIRQTIIAIQDTFGSRVERILGAGGGLLAVVDRVDEEADRTAASISQRVPVALIDLRTLSGLRRLGAASPLAESRTLYEAAATTPARHEPWLLRQAHEKLQGAELLIQQGCPGPALDLLLGALLAGAAVRADQEIPPAPQQAGVWIYAEAVPKGALTPEEAALAMRAIALAQSGSAVPDPMLRQLAEEVSTFLQQTDREDNRSSAVA
jgi:superfamily II DNA or RNA helicase